jgi:hypothetical protein
MGQVLEAGLPRAMIARRPLDQAIHRTLCLLKIKRVEGTVS